MILHDASLHQLCQRGLVYPYEEANLQGCSIDLRLADTIKVESPAGFPMDWQEFNIADQAYMLEPGESVLARTEETLHLPDNVAAQVLLRSSAARAGYDHKLAGWADPGFNGVMVLELQNTLRHHKLELRAGMRLVQLICYSLSESVKRHYGQRGSYQYQQDVRVSTLDFSPVAKAS